VAMKSREILLLGGYECPRTVTAGPASGTAHTEWITVNGKLLQESYNRSGIADDGTEVFTYFSRRLGEQAGRCG